jgi:hypothetical protein
MIYKFLTILLFLLLTPSFGGAYETDQFINRTEVIEDSNSLMSKKVTLAISETITGWHGPRDEMKVVNGIYYKIGGKHWVDKLERFAMDSSEVERLPSPDDNSIYYGHPIWATRVAFFFGVDETVLINGVLVGTDKIGHFLSQGWKFYKRWVKVGDESKAAEQSAFTERALFGQMTTGSYSNADLVANYEGYRFYRSLFEDDIVGNKPAILAWKQDHWIMQRPFDWSDHVNDYWDEALNINHYDKLLYPHMKTRLLTLCDDYDAYPELFVVHNEADLKDRYQNLQLRDTSELRLNNLCTTDANESAHTTSVSPGVSQ